MKVIIVICFAFSIVLIPPCAAMISECSQIFWSINSGSRDHSIDEYYSCKYKEAGIQDENGHIDITKYAEHLTKTNQEVNQLTPDNKAHIERIKERCNNIIGTDAIDTVAKLRNCANEAYKV